MGWTPTPTSDIDKESPVNETVMANMRDNDVYLFDSALRCGIFTTPKRLAMARGTKAFTINIPGGGEGATGVTVTFSSDAIDGNPNFLNEGAPTILLSLEENTASALDWVNEVLNVTALVRSGTITTAGFSFDVTATGAPSGSQTVKGVVHWVAIHEPNDGE